MRMSCLELLEVTIFGDHEVFRESFKGKVMKMCRLKQSGGCMPFDRDSLSMKTTSKVADHLVGDA